jgi:hypothetical protein
MFGYPSHQFNGAINPSLKNHSNEPSRNSFSTLLKKIGQSCGARVTVSYRHHQGISKEKAISLSLFALRFLFFLSLFNRVASCRSHPPQEGYTEAAPEQSSVKTPFRNQ